MKIALICDGVSSGGLYSILSEMFTYHPDNPDLEISLFCSSDYLRPYKNINPKIKIQICDDLICSKYAALFSNKYPSSFVDKINKYNPSAILYISGSCRRGLEKYKSYLILHNQLYISYWRILKQMDIKVVLTAMINAFKFRRNLKHIDTIIYSSEYSKRDALNCFKVKESVVIPLAINEKFLQNLPISYKPFDSDYVNLLNIGSVLPYKNQLAVVKSLSVLKKSGIKFHCTFVGRIISKPYYYLIKAYIKVHGLRQFVTFIPWIESDKIPVLIDECDIYINSSETDTCGTSVEEGMARRKPVIASTIGFNKEKVQTAGLYYNLKKSSELADCIISYINDNEIRDEYSSKAQELSKKWNLIDTVSSYYKYIVDSCL